MTLLEVLIGAVILAMIAVPVFSLLWTSQKGIHNVDKNREARFLTDLILSAAESRDFTELWDNFGTDFDGLGCAVSGARIQSGVGSPSKNPLRLDNEVFDRLTKLGWTITIQFRFLTKNEVQVIGGSQKTKSGIVHLQAGVIAYDLYEGRRRLEHVKKTVFCPMILGRPGLDLNQCPAVNPSLRDGKFGSYP